MQPTTIPITTDIATGSEKKKRKCYNQIMCKGNENLFIKISGYTEK